MIKKLFLSVIVCCIVAVCFASTVAGRWGGTIGGLFDVTVHIKEDNGKITGTVLSQIGEIPLSDGKITGNDIVFKEQTYNGIAISSIKAKIAGDKMDVTVNFQGQDLQGTLNRLK
ncbi:MAG TPA: hypothetical protein DIT07_02870 [Sphingobacteriaceae bacterium]|nr:hypothetical protein [Sphingobacteriaceae bacterium]